MKPYTQELLASHWTRWNQKNYAKSECCWQTDSIVILTGTKDRLKVEIKHFFMLLSCSDLKYYISILYKKLEEINLKLSSLYDMMIWRTLLQPIGFYSLEQQSTPEQHLLCWTSIGWCTLFLCVDAEHKTHSHQNLGIILSNKFNISWKSFLFKNKCFLLHVFYSV